MPRSTVFSTIVALLAGALIVASVVVVLQPELHGQQSPLFTVVSPQNGQVFHPGDIIQVVVQAAPAVTLDSVSVWSPILSTVRQPVSPIAVPVPSKYPLGPVTLGILAKTPDGGGQSIDVTVTIQAQARLELITLSPLSANLVLPGTSLVYPSLSQVALGIIGSFSDGVDRDIVHASGTIITADNPKVATVDSNGLVTAVAPGVTAIIVTSGVLKSSAIVKVNIFDGKGDLTGDGKVDSDDLSIVLKALNAAATGPGDPRDLNGDGKLDALDARILVTLCSKAGCATK